MRRPPSRCDAPPREVPGPGSGRVAERGPRRMDMAPQQLATAALTLDSPYAAGPVTTVPEVIARLEELQSYAEGHERRGQHDGVACFSYLYHVITNRVWEGIQTRRFADAEFVTALDVVFANRYLSAIRDSVVAPERVPEAWRPLFER